MKSCRSAMALKNGSGHSRSANQFILTNVSYAD
jgi:hypothetical protein